VTLRGWLYRPSGDGVHPGVVMAHGFSATKEMGLDAYATMIAGAGIVVLVYDHRSLGASDGEPRRVINPWAQMRDYRYALDWLSTRPVVDPGRLGVWGSSFSGGEVLVLGAVDPRVRAVVANVPYAGAPPLPPEAAAARFAAIVAALDAPDGTGPADSLAEPVGPIAVVQEPGSDAPAFLPQPEAAEWFLDVGADATTSRWVNEVFLREFPRGAVPFDPGPCVERLRAPLLMVVASEDRVADAAVALAAYERAPEPKRLVVIDGNHFAPYSGEALATASEAARDFFAEFLGAN
jgi:fermentation-respiration switch protein FrsA (DUF1100 family)